MRLPDIHWQLTVGLREREMQRRILSVVYALVGLGRIAEKYLHQGVKIAVTGRIQTGSYTNKDGVKVYTTDVVVKKTEFAESKKSQGYGMNGEGPAGDGFMEDVPDGVDEELPFS